MKRILFVTLAGAAAAAGQTQAAMAPYPGVFLASRFDDHDVQILVANISPPNNEELAQESSVLAAGAEPRQSDAYLECGKVICMVPLSGPAALALLTYARRYPARDWPPPADVAIGDRFWVYLGHGDPVAAVVRGFAAGDDGVFGVAVIAEIGTADLEHFRDVTARDYLARRSDAAPPPSLPTLTSEPDSTPAAESIAAALNQNLPDYLAEARAQGAKSAPTTTAEQNHRISEVLAGRGSLRMDLERVGLAVGQVRYYVRAEWDAEGKAAFATAAWVRLDDRAEILNWDKQGSAYCLLPGEMALDQPRTGWERFPRILNAIELPDGQTGLLMYQQGYEGWDTYLSIYDDSGLRSKHFEMYVGG